MNLLKARWVGNMRASQRPSEVLQQGLDLTVTTGVESIDTVEEGLQL